MPSFAKEIVYLSDEQYQELVTNGSITVGGTTVVYNENTLYVTPQQHPYIKPSTGIPGSDLAEDMFATNSEMQEIILDYGGSELDPEEDIFATDADTQAIIDEHEVTA